MDQKATFLASEGDNYFQRNAASFARHHAEAMRDYRTDPVLTVLERLRPKSVLEVGCANGWRLDVAHVMWGMECYGIDPSSDAVAGAFPGITVTRGTAVELPNIAVDCVVFGCVLCWCDRADLYRIAAEADRVLSPGGHIIAYEFFAPLSHVNPYRHHKNIVTHKMDFTKLWGWHPNYTLWSHQIHVLDGQDPTDPNEWFATSVLRKH